MTETEHYRDTVYHNHEPSDKLDYLDIRKTNIEKIKNIIFDLCIEEYDKQLALTNLGPHRQACKVRLKEINEERCWRLQDYEVFMWDFRKDWDLNYEDYDGISGDEVCK